MLMILTLHSEIQKEVDLPWSSDSIHDLLNRLRFGAINCGGGVEELGNALHKHLMSG